jgi:hypothetical protein
MYCLQRFCPFTSNDIQHVQGTVLDIPFINLRAKLSVVVLFIHMRHFYRKSVRCTENLSVVQKICKFYSRSCVPIVTAGALQEEAHEGHAEESARTELTCRQRALSIVLPPPVEVPARGLQYCTPAPPGPRWFSDARKGLHSTVEAHNISSLRVESHQSRP